MHWFDGHGWWMGGWWMIIFWIGVALLFLWGVRQFAGGERGTAPRHSDRLPEADSALAIVKRRYARGEISREEYLALLEDLGYEAADTLDAALARKLKRSE